MSQYAQVVDGMVVNVVLWDGETEFDVAGLVATPPNKPVGIGWQLVDGEWIAPVDEPIQLDPDMA